jgi:hypothetical protein
VRVEDATVGREVGRRLHEVPHSPRGRGLAGNASGSAEEGCAQASRAKFDHAVGNVLGTGCPFCVVDHVNFHPIAGTI